mgnify:CR=1 FL=1
MTRLAVMTLVPSCLVSVGLIAEEAPLPGEATRIETDVFVRSKAPWTEVREENGHGKPC